jgi:diguanylate cyclase (GGDEF)-like protein
MLAVPMWSAGHTIGVLALTSSRPRTFDRRAEELALLLANCAVPPIERARLERLAITDQNTMVFNKRYLQPRLRQEMDAAGRYATALSLLLLDLDRFKRVNDRHGHAAGDQVLRAFVERVGLATRRQDALVRRGGDEFVAILPATPLAAAVRVAERIRRLVDARRFEPALGVSLRQTVSIGVAQWDGLETAEELEARADKAMYQAKRAGRNRLRRAPTRNRAKPDPQPKVRVR